MSRPDHFTHTPDDASAYERAHNDEPERVDPRDVLDVEELRDYFESRRNR